MYQPSIRVLHTSVQAAEGLRSFCHLIYSNGTYFRFNDGDLIGKAKKKLGEIIFVGEFNEESTRGEIKDRILIERIKRYWDEFAVKYDTNCSSFAHYLTTGEFVECDKEKGYLVARQGMRPYEMASRVDIGDMVCLIYGRKEILASRKHHVAGRYRTAKKHRHDKGDFAGCLGISQRSLTADEVGKYCRSPWAEDYHFMVCVAKRQGQPVWLSQGGYSLKGEDPIYTITMGMKDGYLLDIPILAFIKKRR